MNKEIDSYISDPCRLVTGLVEDVFGRPIDELLAHWERFTSYCPAGSLLKMGAAYLFAQSVKDKLPCYGFICMWMAYFSRDSWSSVPQKTLFEEAIKYSHCDGMRNNIEQNYNSLQRQIVIERTTGIAPDAAERIVGVEKLNDFYGEDKWNLHDAVIERMVYHREKDSLEIIVDTQIAAWSKDNHTHTIKFVFSDLVNIETDIERGNDYLAESRIYIKDGFIVAEFESAHMKVTANKLVIGEIGTGIGEIGTGIGEKDVNWIS